MVHCESSVDAFFFPSLFDQEISPPFLVVQRLAFEELLMGNGDFTIDEISNSLEDCFALKGVISLFIPSDDGAFMLQLGDLTEPVLYNNQKIYSYNIIKCNISTVYSFLLR